MATEALTRTTDTVSPAARCEANSIDQTATSAVAYFSLALGAAVGVRERNPDLYAGYRRQRIGIGVRANPR